MSIRTYKFKIKTVADGIIEGQMDDWSKISLRDWIYQSKKYGKRVVHKKDILVWNPKKEKEPAFDD